jgi:chaperone required for assembly of F1-ATPase
VAEELERVSPDELDPVSAGAQPTPEEERRLWLSFHGRVIDHLGLQMYQSPVAALAELVANAWDADSEHVDISLPATMTTGDP